MNELELVTKNISTLFRDTESAIGTRVLAFSVIDSFEASIHAFKGTKEGCIEQVTNMVNITKNTSPRISLIIFMFSHIYDEFMESLKEEDSLEDVKEKLIAIIKKVKAQREASIQKLLKHSRGVIENGDIILLHALSQTVFDLLKDSKKRGLDFEVIIAEQDSARTCSLVRRINDLEIPFKVIPEYLLSHIQKSITKVFSGAVTINSKHHLITSSGTEAVFSEMKYHKKPIYVCITTDKFSLWEAREHHHTHKSKKKKSQHGVEYEKMIFSHDRCDIDMVDFFITNKGVLESCEIKDLYAKLFSARKEWRENHGV